MFHAWGGLLQIEESKCGLKLLQCLNQMLYDKSFCHTAHHCPSSFRLFSFLLFRSSHTTCRVQTSNFKPQRTKIPCTLLSSICSHTHNANFWSLILKQKQHRRGGFSLKRCTMENKPTSSPTSFVDQSVVSTSSLSLYNLLTS